jgi:hypothetical protein
MNAAFLLSAARALAAGPKARALLLARLLP